MYYKQCIFKLLHAHALHIAHPEIGDSRKSLGTMARGLRFHNARLLLSLILKQDI